MRIAVLGAGGVGGYFGARLAADGNDVTFIARGAHAAAMREQGLQVLSPAGDLHLQPVKLHEDWRTTGLVDIVLVAVKMYDLDDAAATDQAAAGDRHRRRAVPERRRGAGDPRAGAGPPLRLRRGRLHRAAIEAPGVIRHTGKDGAARLRRALRDPVLAAGDAGGRLPGGRDRLPCCRPRSTVEVWRKFVFLAPFAGITCFGRDHDRRRARGPAAVAAVHGHGRGGRRRGPGQRRRPAGGRRWRSGSSSPASCRPR